MTNEQLIQDALELFQRKTMGCALTGAQRANVDRGFSEAADFIVRAIMNEFWDHMGALDPSPPAPRTSPAAGEPRSNLGTLRRSGSGSVTEL